MQRLRSLLAVLAFAASFVAFATPITFIHTGVGSGNLAGAAFNGAGPAAYRAKRWCAARFGIDLPEVRPPVIR